MPLRKRKQLAACALALLAAASRAGATPQAAPSTEEQRTVRVTLGSALRNTAVPGTRAGGLTKIASRKPFRSIASCISCSASSRRPVRQVTISVNMPMPMTSGNQPPASSLSMLLAKKLMSMTKKKPVAATHNGSA